MAELRHGYTFSMESPAQPCPVSDVLVLPTPAASDPSMRGMESEAFLSLSQTLARDPARAPQQLVESAMRLCRADSAGLSLEDVDESGQPILRWIATAGEFARYQNGTLPRDFSPCGTAMEQRMPLVMRDPVRHYAYIAELLHKPVATVLLVPFARLGSYVGTVWVAMHSTARSFTTEDQRMVTALSTFASAILDTRQLRKVGGGAPAS